MVHIHAKTDPTRSAFEQLRHNTVAFMNAADIFNHMILRKRNSCISQRFPVSVLAHQVHDALCRIRLRAADDQVIVPEPPLDQMLHGQILSAEVVVHDVLHVRPQDRVRLAGVRLHIGKAGHDDQRDRDRLVVFQPGGDRQNAGNLHGDEGLEQIPLKCAVTVRVSNDDIIAKLLGLFLHALQHERIVGVKTVRHHNAEGLDAAVAEIDRQIVGAVSQGFRDFFHAGSRFGTDIFFAAQSL